MFRGKPSRCGCSRLNRMTLSTIIGVLLTTGSLLAAADEQHDPHNLADRTASGTPSVPPEVQRTPAILRGKPFSEFNHRLAGLFLIVGGGFFLWQSAAPAKGKHLRYVFPLCLFVPGLYLLFLSDPKWPFGPESFWHYFTTNTQFMQHKIFSLLLMVMGTVEFLRERRVLTGTWSAFVFPALGAVGATLLLFHPHAPGHDMQTMRSVESQHLVFALVGGLIVITKTWTEIGWRGARFCQLAWPALLCILGFFLLAYAE